MYRTIPQRFAALNQRLIRKLLLGGLATALAVAIAPSPAFAQVDDGSVFELDGNTQDGDAAGPKLDWESNLSGLSGSAVPITDPDGASIFTTGGSKDEQDISNWRHKDGSVPPKDEMVHAAAKVVNLTDGPAIVFAADRLSNNGDAQIGFWFIQDQLILQSNGTFGAATHKNGDLLVLANFSNGGTVASVEVYEWMAGGPTLVSTAGTAGKCGVGTHSLACAITNTGTINAPASWNYTPKAGAAGTFPPQSFFEGAIDLGSLFPGGAGDIPCFASFLVETRSSTSITATLKDFVAGGFESCGISVTKACVSSEVVGGNMIKYTFGGTVTNDGSGTVYDVVVQDTAVAGNITVAASILAGQSANWSGTATVGALTLANTATAYAASSDNGALSIVSEPDSETCTATVSSSISVSKACDPGTSLKVMGSTVVVEVGVSGQVCNNGDVAISGIGLTNSPAATITLGATSLAAGACTTWSAAYVPSAISSGNGTGPGRYFFDDTIKVTSATPALGPAISKLAAPCGEFACASESCPICPEGFCPVP